MARRSILRFPGSTGLTAFAAVSLIPIFFPAGLIAFSYVMFGAAKLERELGPLPAPLRRRLRNAKWMSLCAFLISAVILQAFIL